MNTQRDINLTFISSKGFDIYTADGLYKALHWLQTADADNLMYGEPSGDAVSYTHLTLPTIYSV